MKINLKLSSRVWIINGFALFLILAVGFFVNQQFKRVSRIVDDLGRFNTAFQHQVELLKGHAALRGAVFRAIMTSERKIDERRENLIQEVNQSAGAFLNSLKITREQVIHEPLISRLLENCEQPVSEFAKEAQRLVPLAFSDPSAMQKEMPEFLKKYDALGNKLKAVSQQIEARSLETQKESAEWFSRNSILRISLFFGFSVLLFIISYFFLKTITSPLNHVIHSLSVGSEQFAVSARLVSSASQHLAMGASQQAASLEEASASLEEIASMTKHNADNAQKTSLLVGQTRSAMEASMDDMKEMSSAMDAIKNSSDSISKIIKTIDEISFQTNILALNAAVEAARAGEAGMGFAVVADEVRNLAQHSAKAARDTAEKIEDSIKKSEQAVKMNAKVGGKLGEVMSDIRQVDELVAEITSASKEQSLGIEQINLAVNQIDEGTQSTAANAEESASAAEQLNAQAGELESAISELVELVGNKMDPKAEQKRDKRSNSGNSGVIATAYKSRITRHVSEGDVQKVTRLEKGSSDRLLGRGGKQTQTADDIPMDQHFKDF